MVLCAPAEIDDESVIDPDIHLTGYGITRSSGVPGFVPQTNLVVANEFGIITVDTVSPDRLLVPSLKSLEGNPSAPDPSSHDVDHFKCYTVRITRGTPKFPRGTQATLVDQFEQEKTYDITAPTRLCVAVEKGEEEIKNPQNQLMCYGVKAARGEPRHSRINGIFVNNQFGPLEFNTVNEAEVCVPSPTVEVGPGVALTLSETAITPGSQLNISWEISGSVPEGAVVLVRVRAPGVVANAGFPGASPPVGETFYLTPEMTWTAAVTPFLSPADSGNVNVILPNNAEGGWQVEVLVSDATGENVFASDAEALLVSSQPSIFLRLSRPIANTNDDVKAILTTSSGSTPRNVRIVSWLVLPDGSQLGVPGFNPENIFLYQGPSVNDEITLFERPFGPVGGVGAYEVQVRLLDDDTGDLIGTANAGFEVCDTPATLTGRVFRSTGGLVDGTSAILASVFAFDIDDRAVTASSSIDALGNYSLSLVPGRYFIMADVIEDGPLQSALPTQLTTVGCDGVGGTLDLTLTGEEALGPSALAAGTSSIRPQRSFRVASVSISSLNASDGLPKPSVLIVFSRQSINVTKDEVVLLIEQFKERMRESTSEVNFTSEFDIEDEGFRLGVDQEIELSDPTFRSTRPPLVVAFPFTLGLRFDRRSFTAFTATVASVEAAGAAVGAWREVDLENDQPEDWGGSIDRLADQVIAANIFQLLRDSQDRPIIPVVELRLSPEEVAPTGMVSAEVTLKDIDGSLQPGEAVEVVHTMPDDPGLPDTHRGLTGFDGVFRKELAATDRGGLGVGKVRARFIRDGVPHEGSAQVDFYRVVEPSGDLRLTTPNPSVRVGDPEQVCALLQQGGSPVAGAVVDLGATRGTLDAASVVTGADGQGCTTFRAGDTTGIATISGENQPAASSTSGGVRVLQAPLTASLELMVDGGVSFGLTAGSTEVSAGGFTSVTADLLVGGARLANIPITFSLSGPGSLLPATAQTDQNGSAGAVYQAPIESGSATITAQVSVNGQSFTRNVTIDVLPFGGTMRLVPESVTTEFNISPPPLNDGTCNVNISQTGNTVTATASGSARITGGGVVTSHCSILFDLEISGPGTVTRVIVTSVSTTEGGFSDNIPGTRTRIIPIAGPTTLEDDVGISLHATDVCARCDPPVLGSASGSVITTWTFVPTP